LINVAPQRLLIDLWGILFALSWIFSAQIAFAQEKSDMITSEFLERSEWDCPRTIYTMTEVFQKRCHPGDGELGAALNVAIAQMDEFFIQRGWSDAKGNARARKITEDFVSKFWEEHPVQTPLGPNGDVCRLSNYEEAYALIRELPIEDIRQWVPKYIAHPPLPEYPGGTRCRWSPLKGSPGLN